MLEIDTDIKSTTEWLQTKKDNGFPFGGDMSFIWWKRYEDSGRQSLPYAGGFSDQPEFWWNDVNVFDQISSIYELEYEKLRLQKRMDRRGRE